MPHKDDPFTLRMQLNMAKRHTDVTASSQY